MQALNFAIEGHALPPGRMGAGPVGAQVLIRVLGFATDCEWHVKEPVAVSKLRWQPLQAVPHGWTNMGKAFWEVAAALGPDRLEGRALTPAVLLVTDGRSTDRPEDFDAGLEGLMNVPAGRAALRLAIAIGRDADSEYLERFIGDPRVPVLVAQNTDEIADRLVAASIAVSHMSEAGADLGALADQVLAPDSGQSLDPADRDTIV